LCSWLLFTGSLWEASCLATEGLVCTGTSYPSRDPLEVGLLSWELFLLFWWQLQQAHSRQVLDHILRVLRL